MTDNIPHIAVLITCFNRRDKTVQCLKNLFCQEEMNTGFAVKIFLVDDASTDGTSETVSALFPDVQVIKGNGHLYWNRGMHAAWQAAKKNADYDYYLWLNDDTDIKTNAIIEMLESAAATKNNAIICGAICSSLNRTFTYGGRKVNGEEIHPNGALQECYTINGNCVLVSKLICDSIGVLDPLYPHAIGDYEYGLRAIKKGFSIVTTPQYIGYCERNAKLPAWCYGDVPFTKRIKALYSPLGNSHPYYFFLFERKYYGWLTAIKHYFTIHLRVLIPALWK